MIDLRSDTVTRPTAKMRAAMAQAPVGDDVYGDDPTVIELEGLAAEVTGKEAALFVCSGTMGNQLAIMTHTRPGDEIITGTYSHIIQHEAGGHARLSGVSAMLADNSGGPITAAQVAALTRDPDDIHHPVTRLLCLENAMSDGTAVTAAQTAEAARAAHERGMQVHLDGARLFNAAAALGTTAKALAADADSVMFCLSKGLCSPVGSMLCGTREFIARARRNRKVLGGGLRQAGVLAACGLISLREMTLRLQEDLDNAKAFAQELAALPGVRVDMAKVQTNMVWADIAAPGFGDGAFTAWLRGRGVLINGAPDGYYRFVAHHDVTRDDLHAAAGLFGEFLRAL
ncbi:MAG TPA: GntG family PLP-dependent aldolase [Candidatus Limnocylindria bacterium]|nr:GntG family PLP-dependent aldolase [Candidatus Limnocylindria bacterium]